MATRQAVAANPSLFHTPADNSEIVGDTERWAQVKADIIQICGPKFGRKVSAADQVIQCRKVLGQSSPEEVLHHRGFSGKWAAELQYEVADFAHKMGQAKKFQVSMDSVLAQYKQNQDDGEPTHTRKKQRTEEQQNSQEQVKASAPSDSTQTQQMLAMMERLEGTLSKLSPRVDSIVQTQVPPQQPKQADIVDMQIEEAAGDQVQLAQNLMAKLQAASTKKDSASGVASAEARKVAALHSEPERAADVASASKLFDTISRKEEAEKKVETAIDTAEGADLYAMKQPLLKLLGKMDSQEHMQLVGLKYFLNEAMADESRSEGASPSLPGASGLGEFIKKPNGDWATGQLCHPYLFATETGNSVQDLVTEATILIARRPLAPT